MALNYLKVEGARVAWREMGSGEAVLLLHGYPQNHACWRHQIGQLARTCRVIAPDWFGWGESEHCFTLKPHYDDEVARIGSLASALDINRFNLIGHDYGGFLALGFAQRHPQRVLRLGLLNSRAQRSFTPTFYRQTALQCRMARTPGAHRLFAMLPMGRLHRWALRHEVGRHVFSAEQLERYIGWLDTKEGRRWFVHFFAHYDVRPRAELRRKLGEIVCPTAVIWGKRDPFCAVAIARELAAAVPQAQLREIEDAGHFVMEECPDAVLKAMQELLAKPC